MSQDPATARAVLRAEEVSIPPGHGLARLPLVAGALGVLGLMAAWFLAGSAEVFYNAYLVAFLFALTLALGGLFFVLLHFLTRAGWSVVVRRLAEHVAGTLPLFLLLFVPVLLGFHELYPWSHAEMAEHDPLVAAKEPFLNAGGFYARSAAYLILWSLLGWWFRRRSLAQDESGDVAITRRLQTLSAPGMVVFAITLTFASFDWVMTLDPHWFSTIFGVYIFSGSVLGILALMILMLALLRRNGLLEQAVTVEHRHDLGKLLFTFVVFWAYIAFSQFLLIWYANIPEETVWFAHRWEHGWRPVSIALAVGHFVIPFFFLLPRATKRRTVPLVVAALWLLGFHYLDLYWLVVPAYHGEAPMSLAVCLAALVGVTGIFLAAVGWLAWRPALVPVKDPRLPESLSFENM